LEPRNCLLENTVEEEKYMKEHRSLGRLGAGFLFTTLLSLLLASVAVEQNKFKTLKRFTQRGAGQMNGYAPVTA
jgi:hypothetical protein